MARVKVGVLRGGPSKEFEVSLKTGQAVLEHVPSDRFEVRDIFIDKQGTWHLRGMPMEPTRIVEKFDVIFNALHGAYGEDGTVQRLLEAHHIPYSGSDALGSALGIHKHLAKQALCTVSGIYQAPHVVLERQACGEEALRAVLETLHAPLVVKPTDGGSSFGIALVSSFDELLYGVLGAFEYADRVLVEEYVGGREVTVGVVEGFRHETLYALPPVLITPTKHALFSYDEKYAGHAREVCPAPLPREVTAALLTAARTVHTTLGLRDYSRSDFIVGPNGIYFIEVNTLPGLTEHSLVPKALSAVGASLPQFLTHILERTLARAH